MNELGYKKKCEQMSIDSAVFFPMPDYAKDLGFFQQRKVESFLECVCFLLVQTLSSDGWYSFTVFITSVAFDLIRHLDPII